MTERDDWCELIAGRAELLRDLHDLGAVALDLRPGVGFAAGNTRVQRTAGEVAGGPGPGIPTDLQIDNP